MEFCKLCKGIDCMHCICFDRFINKENIMNKNRKESIDNSDLDILMNEKIICNYCNEDNKEEDFYGCYDGVIYDKKNNNYYLFLEYNNLVIKYCPMCGRKLFTE